MMFFHLATLVAISPNFEKIFAFRSNIDIINTIMAEEEIIHGYWGIRGAGQVSRHLLAYCEANWKDYRYFSPEEWFDKDLKEL